MVNFERIGYCKIESLGGTWIVYDITKKSDIRLLAEFTNENDARIFKQIKEGLMVPVRRTDLNSIYGILNKTQKKQAL